MILHLEHELAGRTIEVPQLCPEEGGELFRRLGFRTSPLNQLQMRLSL